MASLSKTNGNCLPKSLILMPSLLVKEAVLDVRTWGELIAGEDMPGDETPGEKTFVENAFDE